MKKREEQHQGVMIYYFDIHLGKKFNCCDIINNNRRNLVQFLFQPRKKTTATIIVDHRRTFMNPITGVLKRELVTGNYISQYDHI